MSISLIFLTAICVIIFGYKFYGQYISKVFNLDNKNITPAHSLEDDDEFMPTNPFYLFCQHFSAIAASGPIAGPILAAQRWGWFLPMIWIVVGVILIGAVHDFAVLCTSVRHKAVSIVEIAKEHLGEKAGVFLLWFIWLALIYIIIAFSQVTASTFVGRADEFLTLKDIDFKPGGAVLASAIYYLLLCLLLGVINRYFKTNIYFISTLFVLLTFFSIYLGTKTSAYFMFEEKILSLAIIIYCAIASLLPIWLLLVPRGFLGGFVLLMVIFVGLYGIILGGYNIKATMIIKENIDSIFPFLFVTIACGACSGFHGLVCGGTTSKQIDKESDIKLIGYGAMLAEGVIALIALSTIMIFSKEEISGLKPGSIYGNGIGEYLTLIIGDKYRSFAITFGSMAFSTFVFDTLDVATRIGRYLIEELFSLKGFKGAIIAVFLTLFPAFLFIYFAQNDSWVSLWSLFGSANQLLAALSLFTITILLFNNDKNYWITFLPMMFLIMITFFSIGKIILSSAQNLTNTNIINLVASSLLLILSLFIILNGFYRKYLTKFGRSVV